MGAELDERTIAAEADLLDRSVSFTKGCYTGQELVARLDARGNRVARHLRGLVGGRSAPAGADRRELGRPRGSEIVVEGKVVGTVTSSAWSPALGCPGGARLRAPDRDAPEHRRSCACVRGRRRVPTLGGRAEVRALPLV